jgi:hypothetical protein
MQNSTKIKLVFSIILMVYWGGLYSQQPNSIIFDSIPEKYVIDGSVSLKEVTDTSDMKLIHNKSRYIIKRSEAFTYIGIRSNTNTILNTYLVSPDVIKVLHASAAMGQLRLIKDDEKYVAESTEFDWIYRDPEFWNEMHPDGVRTKKEFYERFGWVASTSSEGSYRDFEMIIHNSLFDSDNTQLIFSYSSVEKGVAKINFKQGSESTSLSGNSEIDLQIHNCYIPEFIKPSF